MSSSNLAESLRNRCGTCGRIALSRSLHNVGVGPLEELACDGARGGLLRDRLGAVFTELRMFAMAGVLWPRAPRPVETIALIEL